MIPCGFRTFLESLFDAPPWWTFNLHETDVQYTVHVFTHFVTVRTLSIVDHRWLGFLVLVVTAMIVAGLLARRLAEPEEKRKPSGPPEV